jgi:hypothetical protein
MSTRMEGIVQKSLFVGTTLRMDVIVAENNRYRVLAEHLPWRGLAEIANTYRAMKVDINNGRPLNLRLHLGAMIAQSMNGWTDRDTEDMVAHHAGVRILCALEESSETIDHTSIEEFRNQIGKDGVEDINRLVIESAVKEGFTGSSLCSSDTTVQESPIAYPTEVDHMRNIGNKLVGIGKRIRKGLSEKLEEMRTKVQKIFTKIRLFTRGKKQGALEKKKKLAEELRLTITRMQRFVRQEVEDMTEQSKERYEEELDYYKLMLKQIRHWMRTGFHKPGKYLSLWEKEARAIVRNKASKSVEFGRRWIVTRLLGGYTIGAPCKKLGSGADTIIIGEVLENFEKNLGEMPDLIVYDRGGDGPKNHKLIGKLIKEKKVKYNGIFRKGRGESLPGLGRNTALKAKRERALSEATISTIKQHRYGFTKPRAKSSESCILKGHAAILGANLNRLAKDLIVVPEMAT